LLHGILKKYKPPHQNENSSLVISNSLDEFANAYWKALGIKHLNQDISDFVSEIQQAMEHNSHV
jgi:hypothetical protein